MPPILRWQARRESNPQPADLESAALPIELLAYHSSHASTAKTGRDDEAEPPKQEVRLDFSAPEVPSTMD